jgi:hypothetical protein
VRKNEEKKGKMMRKTSWMMTVLMEMKQVGNKTLKKITNSFTFIFKDIPAAAKLKMAEGSIKDEYGALDYRNLTLKPDHSSRPLWMV